MEPTQNPNVTPLTPNEAPKSIGPAVGIIVIIIVIILGGLYFWGQRIEKESPTPNEETAEVNGNTKPLSSSDELNTIEAELSATVVEGLGSEMQSIDAEAASSDQGQ